MGNGGGSAYAMTKRSSKIALQFSYVVHYVAHIGKEIRTNVKKTC